MAFSKIKQSLRTIGRVGPKKHCGTLRSLCLRASIGSATGIGIIITATNAVNFFVHCGYRGACGGTALARHSHQKLALLLNRHCMERASHCFKLRIIGLGSADGLYLVACETELRAKFTHLSRRGNE